MKNAIFTLTVFMTALLTGLPAQAQVSFGNATKFNEDWLFRLTDDSTIRTDRRRRRDTRLIAR